MRIVQIAGAGIHIGFVSLAVIHGHHARQLFEACKTAFESPDWVV
jgi:hypothetical protein